jgi:transcriptional regulator with XRE-family HTH domain
VRSAGRRLGQRLTSRLAAYERGANRVPAARLQKLADALEVPVTFFFRGTEPGAAHRDTGFGYLKSKKSVRLARAFAQISSAQARNALMVVAEAILARQRSR